jgi:hypothetical protein
MQRQQDIEATTGPKMQTAVVALFGEWIKCDLPEYQNVCLPEEAFNATDRPYQNAEVHGTHSAGAGANTDNGMSIAGMSLGNRIKFAPYKVCEGNLCKPEWVLRGLQRLLERKRAGVPFIIAGFTFISGVTDPVAIDQVLTALDSEQIDLVAPGTDGTPGINMDDVTAFPVTWARKYKNIIGVTPADETGQRLATFSSYGSNTLSLVAPGVNFRTVSTLDPNGSATISGSSAMVFQVVMALAIVRVYREPDSAKARWILLFTARMFADLEGKLKAAPGATDDAGRMAGLVNVYDALTMQVGCPPQSPGIMWVTKRDNNRAIAGDSVMMTQGPFAVQSPQNLLASDRITRVAMFAYNINLPAGTNPSAINVQARDSAGHTVRLFVEAYGNLAGPLACVTQLNVNLSSQPQLSAGDVALTITLPGGQPSSEAIITIKP